MKVLYKILCLLIIAVFISSCGKKIKPGSLEWAKAPDWVIKGSGAFNDKNNANIFHGVGSANGINNFSLLRTTADDRARNELAKILEVYTASLLRDYQAATTEGDFKTTAEEQHVELAIKTVVSQTLTGAVIVDHWEHPEKNEIFSLARIDLNNVKKGLVNSKKLSNNTRDFIKMNAEKIHNELLKEEDRLKNK